ncbi:DMT family transporter [Rhizobiaceae bacterium BDR2-2]|uniref:DMT family transporter n=1 Tax=Ectorhizobium quercum TaxID=2965071 RepID=A0AAE3MYD0_9HYPH|nr:DMT family transporter [Ectorhizobium quercum]MCX8996556.1 DMT family transporter [Ectorhizobium quercum]
MTRIQANLVLLLAAAIWGGGFVAQSTAMEVMAPFWFVSVRFMVATFVILPFALAETSRATRPLTRPERASFTGVGIALLGGATVQQAGLLTTTVTNASFLTGLYVVLVPVISLALFRRAPHWIVWPAALTALGGIYLLSGGDLAALTGGDLLVMICALFWSMQIILAGHAVRATGRPLTLCAWQFAVTALGSAVIAAVTEPFHVEALRQAYLEILYAGTLASGLAFVLQVVGQRHTPAPQAAIFLSSEALFGALFGALLLGESLPVSGYAGCALLFAAVVAVELVPLWARRRTIAARLAEGTP